MLTPPPTTALASALASTPTPTSPTSPASPTISTPQPHRHHPTTATAAAAAAESRQASSCGEIDTVCSQQRAHGEGGEGGGGEKASEKGDQDGDGHKMTSVLGPEATTMMTAREKRIRALESQTAALESTLTALQAERAALRAKLRSPDDAATTVKTHIRLLHEYNEMRDVGAGLMGLIAERRGVRVRDVFGEFGVEGGD